MVLFSHRRRPTPGAAPGTVTIQPNAKVPQLNVLSFGADAEPDSIQPMPLASIDTLPDLPTGHTIRWVNVSGLGDADVLHAVGKRFSLHPLILEDIANTWQRPKVEAYDDCLFIVTRVPVGNHQPMQLAERHAVESSSGKPEPAELTTRQVSLCVGADFVVTFQEGHDDDVLEPVRRRLIRRKGRLYARGPDYLAYAILDTITDTFFPLLENYGEDVENLETTVIEQPNIQRIGQIHGIKRSLLTARRVIWPQRDMLNTLIRDDNPFVTEETKLFLRDCYDHTIQLLDIIETCREIATGLVDILLSSQGNHMNEVMKVLTIIATIFIPLSFIAGVYGMNFDTKSPWNMPELSWQYGYVGFWVLIVVISGGLLLWFRHKGWIGRQKGF